MKIYRINVEGVFFKHQDNPSRLLGFVTTFFLRASNRTEAISECNEHAMRLASSKGLQPVVGRVIKSRISIEKISEESAPDGKIPPPFGLIFYEIGFFTTISIFFDFIFSKNGTST